MSQRVLHTYHSVVGIATSYRPDGSEFEPQWEQENLSSSHPPRVVLGTTQTPVQCVLGLALTTHKILASRLRMSGAIPQLPLFPAWHVRKNITFKFILNNSIP